MISKSYASFRYDSQQMRSLFPQPNPYVFHYCISKFKNVNYQLFVAEIKFLWYSHNIISVPQDKLIQNITFKPFLFFSFLFAHSY